MRKFLKWLLGIDKLEEKIQHLDNQLKVVNDRTQMNNLRTLMMLEYGDFPELDGRKPIDEFEHPR